MLHRVTGQLGVVGLQVEFQMIKQVIFPQEVETSRGIRVILVGGWFTRLGLDVELSGKADLLPVIDRQVQQAREVVELPLHVGIDQGSVAFPTAPEDVACSPQLVGGIEGMLYLAGCVGKDIGIRRSGRALRIARMGKEAGRPPEELLATRFLRGFESLGNLLEIRMSLRPSRPFGRNVPIVEAIVVNLVLIEELEEYRNPLERVVERLAAVIPRHQGRAHSKGISQPIAHAMPVGGTEAQVILHTFPGDLLVGIVMTECERIVRIRPFVFYFWDVWEVI